MLKALSAALFAPFLIGQAAAQESCAPRETILQQVDEATRSGAILHHFQGAQADTAMKVILEALGAPPRPLAVTEVILLVGPAAGVVALVEGVQVCMILPVPVNFARGLIGAVTGTPA